MKRFRYILVLSVLATAALSWWVVTALCHRTTAVPEAYLNGQYDAVIKAYGSTEDTDRNDLLTGLSYVAQQRYAEANLLFSRIRGGAPSRDIVRWCGLLEIEIRLGRYDRADGAYDACRKAVETGGFSRSLVTSYGLHTLGYLEHMNARYESATITYLKALDANPASTRLEQYFELNTRNNLGNVFYRTGQSARALSTHRDVYARRVALLGPDHPKTGGSIGNLGNVYTALGEYEKALYFHERAADISRRNAGVYDPEFAYSLNNIGLALVQLGRNEEAITYLERALVIKQVVQGDSSATLINTLANLTAANIRLGRLEDASRYAEFTGHMAEVHELQDTPGMWAFEIDRSKLLVASSRIPEAISRLETAWASAVQDGHPVSFRIANNLADLKFKTREYESARFYLDWIDACVRTCTWSPVSDSTLNEDPPVEESIRQWLQSHVLDLSMPTADTAAKAERAARTAERLQSPLWSLKFDRIWYAQAHALYSGLTDLAVREGRLEDVWRHVESRKTLFVRRVQRDRSGPMDGTLSALMQVESDLARAEQSPAAESVQNLIAERVHLQLTFEAAATGGAAADLDDDAAEIADVTERARAESATFHHYFWANVDAGPSSRLHAIVVSADTTVLVPLALKTDIDAALTVFHDAREDGHKARFERASNALSHLLLEPLLPFTKGQTLVVSPDEGLYNLPFELLTYPSGKRLSHLVERHALVYTHAAGRWLESAAWRATSAPLTVRLFDVAFTTRGGLNMDPLPSASAESAMLERMFRARGNHRVERTSDVTLDTFIKQTRQPADIVHVATHSIFDPSTPHGSGILFQRSGSETGTEMLTPTELALQFLPARLFVLSSCESARRTGGLSAAFDFGIALGMAGVEYAVVSNWAVDDAATTEFMARFYTHLLDGHAPSVALQRTKLSFSQESTALSNPSIWGAFVITAV